MSKRQVWLTEWECDLVYLALCYVHHRCQGRLNYSATDVTDTFALKWTRDQLSAVTGKFAPEEPS